MKEAYYYHNNTVIINYSKVYVRSMHELVESDCFNSFLHHYLEYLAQQHTDLHDFLCSGHDCEESVRQEIKKVLNLLIVLEMKDIDHPYTKAPHLLLETIEEGYHYWRSLQRYS
ncbi:MAG: hypothetical protein U0K47_05055, partial [Erysipelotrichaceae bacterium]|nr:hypothetical protein [Erysipelotrichaceae bacterium]